MVTRHTCALVCVFCSAVVSALILSFESFCFVVVCGPLIDTNNQTRTHSRTHARLQAPACASAHTHLHTQTQRH
jgi:hypothetical protein